jgi:hypothetical protein
MIGLGKPDEPSLWVARTEDSKPAGGSNAILPDLEVARVGLHDHRDTVTRRRHRKNSVHTSSMLFTEYKT